MRLIYITSKTFPSSKVEPFIIKSAANAFNTFLGQDFTLLIRGSVPKEFDHLKTASIKAPNRFKALYYFFVLPFYITQHYWGESDVVFYSSDPYLLASLVFWRKVLRFRYHICSEWHQLFDNWADSYVANNSDYLVSTSERLKSFIVSATEVEPGKIEVPYGGVDTAFFEEKVKMDKWEYRKKLDLPTDRFIVGYAGAYKAMHSIEKGVSTMIQALPYLDPNILMAFVGGSQGEIDEYSSLARKHGVLDRCLFVKKLPFEKLVEYELAVDVLVIPNPANRTYYTDYTFPFKVWEYLASGTPIIYSNLEIIDEVLNGRGTPFQPEDTKSLAAAITTVRHNIDSEDKRAKLNRSIVQAYTWKARAKKTLDFIQK